MVPSTPGLRSSSSQQEQTPPNTADISYVCWCHIISYTKPEVEMPSCVILMGGNIRLLRVTGVDRTKSDMWPTLEYTYCIPLSNIQQAYLGHQDLFLRIEEAFVGPQGTFTFLMDPEKLTEFYRNMRDLFCKIQSGPYKEDELPLARAHDLAASLKSCASSEIDVIGANDIKLYMLVRPALKSQSQYGLCVHSIIMTPRQILLFKEDYIHTPPPTFAIGPSTRPQFQLVDSVKFDDRITSVNFYELNEQQDSASQTGQGVQYSGFGISLLFEIEKGDIQTKKEFDIILFSEEQRDLFLSHFTKLRSARGYPALTVETIEAQYGRPQDLNRSTSYLGDDPAVQQVYQASASVTSSMENVQPELGAGPVSPTFPPAPDSAAVAQYPGMELLSHLTSCNDHMTLLQPLSSKMANLASMTGEEALNFFHNSIARGSEGEELRHILWTSIIPFVSPGKEITTCIYLTTKAVYFLSDTELPNTKSSLLLPVKPNMPPQSSRYEVIKPIAQISHSELKQVHVSLFDQSFRLSGDSPEKIFACVTRDNELTGLFIQQLMCCLVATSPFASPDAQTPETEHDIYKAFSGQKRHLSFEFMHSSNVRFLYPTEDSIQDVVCLVLNRIQGMKPKPSETNLIMYSCLFQSHRPGHTETVVADCKARTLVLTNTHISLLHEDHVSYPIPSFMTTLPDKPHYEVMDVKHLDTLQRIVMSDFQSHDLTLVLLDETEEIVVDTRVDHFSRESVGNIKDRPEISWTLLLQNLVDKERLIKLISQQWAEINNGKVLSVQVSS